MSRYSMEVTIPNFFCDQYGYLKPVSLLKYLGEASSMHSDSLGVGFSKLSGLNFGWVLNRWRLRINKYPKAKEKILIETWTSNVYKFYANREFTIWDAEGNKIGMASTVWIFIDVKKKRPRRIPKEVLERYSLVNEREFTEFYDFKDNIRYMESKEFSIRRSDIDYNRHVNNVNYFAWILETIPQNVYDNFHLEEFEILYKQELKYGNTILSKIDQGNFENHNTNFLHAIESIDSININAYAKTTWKER